MMLSERLIRQPSVILSIALALLIFAIPRPAAGAGIEAFAPVHVGGAYGYGDQRDADVYPVVAYDATTRRYLVVWLSPRNAGSSSDGFDLYGVFLDQKGKPIGTEFRISDGNYVARNALPSVAAGRGEFVVVWTRRESPCKLYAQRVTDTSFRYDEVLVSKSSHTPHVVYNPVRRRYMVVYVNGADYLPPTFFGAQTADCGNDQASRSRIEGHEFYFEGNALVHGTTVTISDTASGAFRPRVGYSPALRKYLVVWEDRRNARGNAYRFDVYAQRVRNNLTLAGNNFPLTTGGDYRNYDTSATWTPRPAVAGGSTGFLAAWFARSQEQDATVWRVQARLVPNQGPPSALTAVAEMPFAEPHPGAAPTGFLATAYFPSAQEYLIGMTTHLESLWGYRSFALVQRIRRDGRLLRWNGTLQPRPGIGYSVDYDNESQIAVGLTVGPARKEGWAEGFMVYSKHQPGSPAQNFDIWGVPLKFRYLGRKVYTPLVSRTR